MLSLDRTQIIKELFEKINIQNCDETLFEEALTHPSFNFERNVEDAPDYERLEFLGDSVLRLVISEYLFDRFPNYDEGKLTKIRSCLVSDDFLAKIATEMHLSKYLKIGHHEEKDGGRSKPSILACTLEAIFGAVYKTLGYDVAKQCICFVYEQIKFDAIDILNLYNSKEILQQYTQSQNKDLPVYKIEKEYGQAHNKTYEVSVSYNNTVIGTGIAKTKKEAEKMAAYQAIKNLNLVKD